MAKPVVDRLEEELEGVRVVRVSVGSPEGSRLARQMGVRGVPTLLLVDGAGNTLVTQVGRLQRSPVIEALDALQIAQARE